MKSKAKYTTYKQLGEAFASGELTKYHYLMLDKGATENCLNYYNPDGSDEENEKMQDECSELFDCPDIETSFADLGIPTKWC